jgi:hypothetical protein
MEDYYGVAGLFSTRNYQSCIACPSCGEYEDLDDYYPTLCCACKEVLEDGVKHYIFFGEYYCLECLMELLPDSKQLLEEYIHDSCSFFLKRFHEYRNLKDTKEIILIFAKEDSLFIEDYLLFLEEQVEGFKEKDIKDLDYHCYSQMCAGCEDERRCHEDCETCEEYQDFLELLEALEELENLS